MFTRWYTPPPNQKYIGRMEKARWRRTKKQDGSKKKEKNNEKEIAKKNTKEKKKFNDS